MVMLIAKKKKKNVYIWEKPDARAKTLKHIILKRQKWVDNASYL